MRSQAAQVDLVLPPRDIGARLATLAQDPYLTSGIADRILLSADSSDQFPRVLTALQKTSGVDSS